MTEYSLLKPDTEYKTFYFLSTDPGQHTGDLHLGQRAQPRQARAGRLCWALQVNLKNTCFHWRL